MNPREAFVAAMSEAGYPPTSEYEDNGGNRWVGWDPVPPLGIWDRAVGLVNPLGAGLLDAEARLEDPVSIQVNLDHGSVPA